MNIKRLLIANRGEIAVRIIKSCREVGIRTVAVYSDSDANALHRHLADESVPIGAAEASSSYLSVEKILAAAQDTRCDAIHPGYGFLSERAELAEACEAAGIAFVGPPSSAMRVLGHKTSAKALAREAGVPIVPGFFEPGAGQAELAEAAQKVGYPVLLKASAGGGGRGMRLVREAAEFGEAFEIATSEAVAAFGDGSMMVEKSIVRPRHIEVQILVDGRGEVACLFERECSLQRRHQKLIEETPSPFVQRHPDLWPKMASDARELAHRAGYRGAGTVEFLVDPSSCDFYFLEVNTRLQVEHPVTEAVTGLDLVRWQLQIASGEPLGLPCGLEKGDRSAIQGHAIEARILAENPAHGFAPSAGPILGWAEPKAPGIRVDSGYGPASEVSRYYDSLLAKLIAHASSREDAVQRLEAALLDFHILGVRTNIAFLIELVKDESFQAGDIDTELIDRCYQEWKAPDPPPELSSISELASSTQGSTGTKRKGNPAWDANDGFRNG